MLVRRTLHSSLQQELQLTVTGRHPGFSQPRLGTAVLTAPSSRPCIQRARIHPIKYPPSAVSVSTPAGQPVAATHPEHGTHPRPMPPKQPQRLVETRPTNTALSTDVTTPVRSPHHERPTLGRGRELCLRLQKLAKGTGQQPGDTMQVAALVERLGAGGPTRLAGCNPWDLGNTMYALVRLRERRVADAAAVLPAAAAVLARAMQVPLSQFNGIDCAQVSINLSKLEGLEGAAGWFQRLAAEGRSVQWGGKGGPQSLANTVYALGLAQCQQANSRGLLDHLLQLALQDVGRFTAQALSNLLWGLARLAHPPTPDQLDAFLAAAVALPPSSFTTQSLSNIIWACGALHPAVTAAPPHLSALTATLLAHLEADRALPHPPLNPQHAHNPLWALATIQHPRPPPEHITALLTILAQNHNRCTPRQCASALWASAALRHPLPPAVAAPLLDTLHRQADKCTPQDIADILWACATLRHPLPPALLSALLDELVWKLQHCTPRHLSSTLWACSCLRHPLDSHIVDAMLTHMLQQHPLCSPKDISMALLACARLQHALPPQQASHLAAALVRQLRHADSCTVPNALWALTAPGLAEAAQQLLLPLPRYLAAKAHEFSPRGIANTARALAKLRHHDSESLRLLAGAAVPLLPAFSAHDLASFAWALAAVDPAGHRWLVEERLQPAVVGKLGELTAQGVGTLAWALAVVLGGGVGGAAVLGLLRRAAEVAGNLDRGHLLQLYALLHLCGEGVRAEVAADAGLSGLAERCRVEYGVAGGRPPSTFQRYVCAAVRVAARQLGGQVQEVQTGVVAEGGVMYVNVAVTLAEGGRVAVEMNGPRRYSTNELGYAWVGGGGGDSMGWQQQQQQQQQYFELGSTVLRRAMLEREGWRVLSVPFYEWNRLQEDGDIGRRGGRVEYLRSRLQG